MSTIRTYPQQTPATVMSQTVMSQKGKEVAMQRSAREIQQWLIAYLANVLAMPQEDVETDVAFDSYGLDSAAAVGMTGALEAWLGQDVDPTLPYIYTTIETLAQHLATGVDIKAHQLEAL